MYRNDCRLRRPGASPWPVLLALLAVGLPNAAASQELQGFVRDLPTGRPVVSVLVRVESLGDVTLTDMEGRFFFHRLPKGRYTLLFRAMGYEDQQVPVQVPSDVPPEVLLQPKPIELRGIEVQATSVLTRLDTRLARLPGASRVVNPERVRAYDTIQKYDPWRLLWRELRVGWHPDEGVVRVLNRPRRPEVYVDDHKTWLLNLVLMPNTLLCRVEFYEPIPYVGVTVLGRGGGAVAAAKTAFAEASGRTSGEATVGTWATEGGVTPPTEGVGVMTVAEALSLGQVPMQIRAYTCLFMAEVQEGKRTLRRNVNWGDLIAGPGG